MALQLPNDIEALVQKRLASGGYADAEDVLRRALEALDADDSWADDERRALDDKIDRAMAQMSRGEGIPGAEARTRSKDRKAAWIKEHPDTPE